MWGLGGVALALLFWAAWLFLPSGGADEADLAPAVRVAVVDASASARRRRARSWLPWVRATLRAESEAAEAAAQDFAVVVFAARARLRFGPAAPAAFRAALLGRGASPFDPAAEMEDDGASDLASALRVALSLALGPGRRPGRIVLLGEGDYTGEDPLPLLAELGRRGGGSRVVGPPPPDRADLALLALESASHVEEGAPLRAVAVLSWSPARAGPEAAATGARLRFEVCGGGGRHEFAVPLPLPPGGGVWRRAVDLGPAGFGRTEIRATVELAGGPDPIPENDAARTSAVAEGEIVVGVVADADTLAAARRWLAPSGVSALPGLQLEFVSPAGLAGLVADLDALVTFDLPLYSLDRSLVETFVRAGGGWLATAGWRFLYDWTPGEESRGLHGLLPLEPAPLEQGPRDVVLLMDGSGSMAGEPFDILRTATIDLVAAALPTDQVSLRFFTGSLGPATVIKERRAQGAAATDAAAEAARRLVNARVPGGITYLFASLESFAAEREGRDTECLALLLSDGRERETITDAHREERARAVLERLRAARTELVVIGVGNNLDEWTLSLFTRPGEPLARASELEDLQAIFRREIHGEQLLRGGPIPLRVAPLPAPPVRSVAREALGGVPGELPPPPVMAIRNRTREGAETAWIGAEGEPMLAVQRVGRGRTAQLSTCPIEEWAPGWAGRAGAGEPRFFGPLLRWLGRREDRPRGGEVTARVEGGVLVVEGLPTDAPALLEARLIDSRGNWRSPEAPSGLSLTLSPPPGRPGLDPRTRREATLPRGFRRGFASRSVALLLGEAGGERRLLPLDLGLAPEFRGPGPRVSETGFRAAERAGEAPTGDRTGGRAHPAAALVLAAGLVLFTLAGLGRRLAERAIKAGPRMVDR